MKYLKRKTGFNLPLLMAAAILPLFFAACGGGDGGSTPRIPNDPVTPIVSISIFPTTANIKAGESVTFTVTPQNTGFTVSASGGNYTTSGNSVTYTSPSVTGEYELTVTATADTAKKATAKISVLHVEDISQTGDVDTELYGINNNGQVIGEYIDSLGNRTAFLKTGSTYTPITPPGAVGDVYVYGINDSGNVLGYADGGYFLRSGTAYQDIGDYPGADYTDYTDINNSGMLAGYITDGDGYSRGFIRNSGSFTLVDHPDADMACAYYNPCGTWLTGINNLDNVTGVYRGTDGRYRSFIKDGGNYIPIEYSGGMGGQINVYVEGINDSGQAVGYFWGATGYSRGFIKDGGRFTEFIHPDAASSGLGTYLTGINNSGQASGWFDDGEKVRGFVADF